MAKKKLILNEGVTRRFMKLAEIDSIHASTFINEMEDEMGDPVGAEPDMGMDGGPADMGAEEAEDDEFADEEAPAGDSITLDAEQFVGDIVNLLQDAGADIELDTGEEESMEDEPIEDEPIEMAPPNAPVEDEEALVAEVARRVSQRLMDAASLVKASK
ncbi:MAG TPA: hypothetical protein EYN67_04035 [Flavobacteriales bacterium]|jgi:hypothetical protein|nr:hypothetical protein [Flavobacteriales bacterium]